MRLRFPIFAALVLMVAPLAARSQEAPAVVVRLKSVDGLLSDAKYLAKLAGQEEAFKQAEEMIKTFTTEEGLGGIDTKRPFALYGTFAEDVEKSALVALVPIANEKAFVDFLGNFMIDAKKGDDGVYSIENVPNLPVPVYFRFANKYAYVCAMDKTHIATGKMLAPENVLPAAGDDAIASVNLNIAKVPDLIKQLGLGQLEAKLSELKDEKLPNETEATKKLKVTAIELFLKRLQMLLMDGEELSLRLAINQKKDDISLDLTGTPKAGSEMAKIVKGVGETTSLYAGIADPNGALNFSARVSLPDEIKKLLGPAVDDLVKQAVESEKADGRNFLKAFLEKLAPTLKSGEYDLGVGLRGPNAEQHYTLVGVLGLSKGKELESFVKTIVSILPEKDAKKIEVDAASAGDIKIHKIVVGDELPPEQKKVFGSDSVYIAFRDDAMFVTFGADGLKLIKEIVTAQAKAGPAVSIQASLSRIAPLMEAKDRPSLKLVEDVFGKNPQGTDTFTLKVEGGAKANLQLSLKGKLIEFAVKAQEANGENK